MLGVPSGSARAPRFMPMDLYRSGDHYVLHADLPGVDPGSVDVGVENGTLTIKAQRSERTETASSGSAVNGSPGPTCGRSRSVTRSTLTRSPRRTPTAC